MITGLPPILNTQTRILILGTMPGERSIASGEYYAHPTNQFRRLVANVFGIPEKPDYGQFVDLLLKQHIGLWSVLRSCERSGSADSGIDNGLPNNVPELLAQHPGIGKICFESIRARQLFDQYFSREQHISYVTLPASSGLFSKMAYADKLTVWKENLLPDKPGQEL